jgi:hypothetical protein
MRNRPGPFLSAKIPFPQVISHTPFIEVVFSPIIQTKSPSFEVIIPPFRHKSMKNCLVR